MRLGLPIDVRLAPTRGGEAVFTPASLFASGEQGAWYDPSDLSSMFQDSAGTTPVTAAGQPVGKINDKSGRGNHLTQITAGERPILGQDGGGRYCLEFDGVNDHLTAGDALDLGTNSLWAVAAAKFDTTADGTIFAKALNAVGAARYSLIRSGGSLLTLYDATGAGETSGGPDSSTALRILTTRINRRGSLKTSSNGNQLGATTAFADDRASNRNTAYRFVVGGYNNAVDDGVVALFDGSLYGLIIRLAETPSEADIRLAERHLATAAGVSI